MKHKGMLITSAMVAGSCYFGTWLVVHAQASLPSYAATFDIKQYDASTRLISTQTAIKAERGDGSRVSVRAVLDSRPVGIRSVVDVTSKKRVTVDPATESVTTYNLAPAELKQLASPAQCRSVVPGVQETIMGFQTVRADERTTAGQRVIARQQWMAPALNCLPLRSITDVTDDGQLRAHIVEQVV